MTVTQYEGSFIPVKLKTGIILDFILKGQFAKCQDLYYCPDCGVGYSSSNQNSVVNHCIQVHGRCIMVCRACNPATVDEVYFTADSLLRHMATHNLSYVPLKEEKEGDPSKKPHGGQKLKLVSLSEIVQENYVELQGTVVDMMGIQSPILP